MTKKKPVKYPPRPTGEKIDPVKFVEELLVTDKVIFEILAK